MDKIIKIWMEIEISIQIKINLRKSKMISLKISTIHSIMIKIHYTVT